MPQSIFHRRWCTTCNEWTLFQFAGTASNCNKHDCRTCKQEHVMTPLDEIPIEKVEEQRRRYKDKKMVEVMNAIGFASHGFQFGGGSSNDNIVEDDAGQFLLDQTAKEERERIRDARKAHEEKFRHVGRNEPCLCGSGLKYKKCCIDAHP